MKRIELSHSETDERGAICIFDKLPFDCKRFFTICATKGQIRGEHAHLRTKMLLYAINGRVQIEVITKRRIETDVLTPNSFGLLLMPSEYRRMIFQENSCLIVLADTTFDKNDYVFVVPK